MEAIKLNDVACVSQLILSGLLLVGVELYWSGQAGLPQYHGLTVPAARQPKRRTPMMLAAYYGSYDVLCLLLDKGSYVNQ